MRLPLPIADPVRTPPLHFIPGDLGASTPTELIDSHGRQIRDLRISLTDRCNFRCVYCMDPDVTFMPKPELLTDSEVVRLVKVCHALGVQRVRLTGGEPTLHPTLTSLIAKLSTIGLDELTMTTNGSTSSRDDLLAWKNAGLGRITISLDTLRPDRFTQLTRSTSSPARVLQTAQDAIDVGLNPVKLNAVIVKGFNDDEVADLAALARDMAVDIRLIEYMPLDSGHHWDMDRVVTADTMIKLISDRFPIQPIGRDKPSSPSLSYSFSDGAPGSIGIIASVTRPFCGACSRLRITADGKIMPCLFSRDEWDLRPTLRSNSSDDDVALALAHATLSKQAGHRIGKPDYQQPDRPMSAIGG